MLGLSLVVEELCGCLGVHDVGPCLFGWQEFPFRECVLGEPRVRVAAGDAGEDHGGEAVGDGAADPDRNVGLVAVYGTDDDAEAEAGEVGGVLVAVAQGAGQELPQDRVEPAGQPGACLDEVAIPVVRAWQERRGVGVGGERLVVFGVVALARCAGLCVERGVEVVRGTFLADAGGDEPVLGVIPGFTREHRAAPAPGLHLEQHNVIDGGDPLMRDVRRGELSGGLPEDRVVDLIQRYACRWQRQVQVVSQAAERRAHRHRVSLPSLRRRRVPRSAQGTTR